VRNLIWDVQMAPEAGADLLGRAVLAILLVHPALLPEVAHEVETLDCPHPAQARLRDALLRHAGAPDLFAVLAAEGGAEGVEALLADAHIVALRPPGDVEAARLALAEALARLAARRSLAAALREAEEEIATAQDERVTVVLAQVAAPFDPARRMDGVDAREVVVAPNGVALDKAETERASRQREDIDFSRGGRGGHVRRP
jgi:DNA primase